MNETETEKLRRYNKELRNSLLKQSKKVIDLVNTIKKMEKEPNRIW